MAVLSIFAELFFFGTCAFENANRVIFSCLTPEVHVVIMKIDKVCVSCCYFLENVKKLKKFKSFE
jgi:hypothetical protein